MEDGVCETLSFAMMCEERVLGIRAIVGVNVVKNGFGRRGRYRLWRGRNGNRAIWRLMATRAATGAGNVRPFRIRRIEFVCDGLGIAGS